MKAKAGRRMYSAGSYDLDQNLRSELQQTINLDVVAGSTANYTEGSDSNVGGRFGPRGLRLGVADG